MTVMRKRAHHFIVMSSSLPGNAIENPKCWWLLALDVVVVDERCRQLRCWMKSWRWLHTRASGRDVGMKGPIQTRSCLYRHSVVGI